MGGAEGKHPGVEGTPPPPSQPRLVEDGSQVYGHGDGVGDPPPILTRGFLGSTRGRMRPRGALSGAAPGELLGCTGGTGWTGLCWAWAGGAAKSSSLQHPEPPPPRKPHVGQCGVPGALQGPHPMGYPQLHGSHPTGQPQPHPVSTPSPTSPIPWVPPAPHPLSHGYISAPCAPILPGISIPSCSEGLGLPTTQAKPGCSAPCRIRPAVANTSAQSRSILPQHSGAPCLSFPQSQGEGSWLGGGSGSLPGSSHPPASFMAALRGRNCGGTQRQQPGSTRRAQDRKKRGLFLAWFLRK